MISETLTHPSEALLQSWPDWKPPQEQRFTIDGSPELEAHLQSICKQVLAGVQWIVGNKLQALILAGGYGRGEGGVLRQGLTDLPYNDLEFYVFLRGNLLMNEKRFKPALTELGHSLSQEAEVEVEFKIISRAKLRRCRISMFYYDLVRAHRVIWGSEGIFEGCEHHRKATLIPMEEAARLLMNRGSGLLFAKEQLQRENFTPENADFVGRNLAKTQLALGDVVLTVYDQYHWSVLERHHHLNHFTVHEMIPRFEEIREAHAKGVKFKLHPQKTSGSRNQLAEEHQKVTELFCDVWLWLERHRLHRVFPSIVEYALSTTNKFPNSNPLWNRLINVRILGPQVLKTHWAPRHPRERVMHALALLLQDARTLNEPRLLRAVQDELQTSETTLSGLVTAYRELWQQVN
jgi:hypothetical protein